MTFANGRERRLVRTLCWFDRLHRKGPFPSIEPVAALGHRRPTTSHDCDAASAALAKALEALPEDKREPVDGFSPRKLRNYYMLNPEEDGDRTTSSFSPRLTKTH